MTSGVAVKIPESHHDLLDRPIVVTIVTLMADGQPQATPVWVTTEGDYVIVNTARGRQKDQNMEARPRVSILSIDPDDPYRWLEVRGVVEEITEVGAKDVIDQLSLKYKGRHYYGDFQSAEKEFKEQRVTYKIRPTHVAHN